MTNMLLSRLSHFTRSAAAGAFAVLYPAPAAEAGADVVISDPVALPPDNPSASSPTSSPNQDIVKGLIRNQVAGLLNILLATKETLDPDLQKLIPVLQDANTALKRRPAPAQQQRPRGTRGGGRQKKSASRATRITSLRAAPTMGSQAAAPKTLPPSRPSPAPTSLDATAPPWPRGQSPPQQAPSPKSSTAAESGEGGGKSNHRAQGRFHHLRKSRPTKGQMSACERHPQQLTTFRRPSRFALRRRCSTPTRRHGLAASLFQCPLFQ